MLAGQIVELVAGAARVDEVGGDEGVVSDGAEALASSRRACESPPRLRRDGSPPRPLGRQGPRRPVETAARSSARASPNGALCWFNTSSSSAASRHATDSVSAVGAAAGMASSSVSTRLRRPRNSKRRKISFSAERSGGEETSSAGSTSSGRSRRIVARSFESRAWSACSRTARLRAGESSSACAITSSSDPYCAISWPAVLSPIPGIPGMLSEVSPFSPMKSGTWSGRTP